MEYTLTLSAYSRDLRTLVERDEVSQTAVLIGSSIAAEPSVHGADRLAIARRREGLLPPLQPQSVKTEQLMAIRRRKAAWEIQPDWYESMDRDR